MTTIWTKNAKESFVESIGENIPNNETTNETTNETNNRTTTPRNDKKPNDAFIGKDPDELILMSNSKDIESIPTPTPTSTPTSEPSSNDNNGSKSDFNFGKAMDDWKSSIGSLQNSIGNSDASAAENILYLIHPGIESPEAKKDLKNLSSQISRWFKIVIASYIVALNLWYLWWYTTFTFDLRSLIFLKPNPILAPAINAIEVINYYLINIRMDSEPLLPFGLGHEDIRKIWHWRPITFTILHFLLILIFFSSYLFEGFSSVFSLATDSALYYLACAITAYYYAVLYKSWYKIPLSLSGGVVGLLLLIAVTILTILSVGIVVPICLLLFTIYLTFLSNTALFAFNWFWPPSIISSVIQIFQELKEAPVFDDNPPDYWGKVGNYLFQNFHNIYLVVIILFPLLIINVTESAKFSTNLLITIGIVVNIILFLLFSWSGVKDVIKLIILLFKKTKSVAEPTEPVPSTQASAPPLPSNAPGAGLPVGDTTGSEQVGDATGSEQVGDATGPEQVEVDAETEQVEVDAETEQVGVDAKAEKPKSTGSSFFSGLTKSFTNLGAFKPKP